jgi:hypothetical protein
MDYNIYNSEMGAAGAASGTGMNIVLLLLLLGVIAFMIVAMWRVFEKAGQPGWTALIPIYNTYILLKIASRPGWWLLLLFIPFVNFIVSLVVHYDVAKAFGRGMGYMLLLAFVPIIGWPLLAWGDVKYKKPGTA